LAKVLRKHESSVGERMAANQGSFPRLLRWVNSKSIPGMAVSGAKLPFQAASVTDKE
jgi:hypothetical protein